MSSKEDKKIRRVVRKQVKVDLKDTAISLQSLILKFGFRQRLKIAIKILRGKVFLSGTIVEKNKTNSATSGLIDKAKMLGSLDVQRKTGVIADAFYEKQKLE